MPKQYFFYCVVGTRPEAGHAMVPHLGVGDEELLNRLVRDWPTHIFYLSEQGIIEMEFI